MQINLSGHHIEITPALRSYVTTKMARLERHFDSVDTARVTLSVEKLRHKAEATLHLSGADLFADANDENMYAAIDALVDKLNRQVRKHKEKSTNYHRGNVAPQTENFDL